MIISSYSPNMCALSCVFCTQGAFLATLLAVVKIATLLPLSGTNGTLPKIETTHTNAYWVWLAVLGPLLGYHRFQRFLEEVKKAI